MNHTPDYYKCPRCHQDFRAQPHEGVGGKDCSLCGQGIEWRRALAEWRAKSEHAKALRESKGTK